jgi:hypothetical protein
MQEGETLISAFHFSKEPSRWHGIPFRFVVKPVRPVHRSNLFSLHLLLLSAVR